MNILQTVPVGMLFLYLVFGILAIQAVTLMMRRSGRTEARYETGGGRFRPEPDEGISQAAQRPEPVAQTAPAEPAPKPHHIMSTRSNMWPQMAQPQMAQAAVAYAEPTYQQPQAYPTAAAPQMHPSYAEQTWIPEQSRAAAYAQQIAPVQPEPAASTMSPQLHMQAPGHALPLLPSPVMMAHMAYSTRMYGSHAASRLFSPEVQYYQTPAEQPKPTQAETPRFQPEPTPQPELKGPVAAPQKVEKRPVAPMAARSSARVAASAGHGLEVVPMAKMARASAPANSIGRAPRMSLESIRRQVA